MKISALNNISFEKKLIAKCEIGAKENKQKAKIYEIEYPNDITYFEKMKFDDNWKNSFYLSALADDLENAQRMPFQHFFAMEDFSGNCLCISELDKSGKKENSLDFIETAPALSSYRKQENRIKYIGETMLAFLVKLTKKEDKKRFRIPIVAKRVETENFYYKQCGFERQGTSGSLKRKDYDTFIDLNEKHTDSEITFEK